MEEVKKKYETANFNLEIIIFVVCGLFLLSCGILSGNLAILGIFVLVLVYSVYKFNKQGTEMYELDSQGLTITNRLNQSKRVIFYENIKAISYMKAYFGRRSRGYSILIKHGPTSADIAHSMSTTITFVGAKKNECFDFLNTLGEKIGKEKILNMDRIVSDLSK